jgi:hypothetical protein
MIRTTKSRHGKMAGIKVAVGNALAGVYPAQIRACGAAAHGSYFGGLA